MAKRNRIVAPPQPAWDWFCKQPHAARQAAIRRHTAIEKVRALQDNGYTLSAAIAVVSVEHGVSTVTLWRWHRLTRGVVHSDRRAQMAALCLRPRKAAHKFGADAE
ncbi:MAG: hypothetical protein NTX28_10035 [Novosphingobium sp.]|nr:hypothetical protein [Novosphingobium sp.]